MSVLTQKSPAKAKGKPAGTVLHGLPQVNLLPPEIRATRALATVKRWLVIALVIVVGLVGAVYAFSLLDRASANSELADADGETVRLRAEERQYAEVPQVLDAIGRTTDARTAGMADEILWKGYIDAIAAVLPADVSIDSFQLAGPAATTGGGLADSPLQSASIGAATFSARTRTVPKTAEWLDALTTVPGFTDPWASTVTVTEEESTTFFTVSMSVRITSDALANRFVPTPQEKN